jgi:hypothetical protein
MDCSRADSVGGLLTFAGRVEGCGTSTVFLDVAGEGFTDESGVNTFTSNTLTVVTGGTIPVRGSIDESGPQVPQDDGTVTMAYTATYEC